MCLQYSPLSLSRKVHASATHAANIRCLHFYRRKPLFVSASDDKTVKVWNFKDITAPYLLKSLPNPGSVFSVKYSESGLLLIGCFDGMVRVYGKEPLFSLCWSFNTSGYIYSVSWSPSNRICASFKSGNACAVQVWDSSFQTIFKLQQRDVPWNGVAFASNDLLMVSDGTSNKVYWYNISKPKVMKVFMERDVLPFCRDVLKIVIEYLPFVTRVTHNDLPDKGGCVTALSSEVVGVKCDDDVLRLYNVDGNDPRLLVSLPHKYCNSLATCVYPCSGKETGFMLASSSFMSRDVIISITTPQVCIM